MIPFQLGFRNLLGILLPGAVLAMVIFVCLEKILCVGMGRAIAGEIGLGTGPVVVAFLLTAYILGSVIRLWSADTVDRLSAMLVWARFPIKKAEGNVETRLRKLLDEVKSTDPRDYSDADYFGKLVGLQGSAAIMTRKGEDLIRWAWARDTFPYPAWEIMKLRLYHPYEVFRFFQPSVRCFATGSRRNKEFFNYCKAVVYEAHDGKRHSLAEEVQSAEANVRFFAGVFWALLLSALALELSSVSLSVQRGTTGKLYWLTPLAPFLLLVLIGLLWLFTDALRGRWMKIIKWVLRIGGLAVLVIASACVLQTHNLSVTEWRLNGIAFTMLLVNFFIVADGRFRLSRMKEVDTVFDAFYLVQRPSRGRQARPGRYQYNVPPKRIR